MFAGSVEPHGYWRCSLPPAAAYCHSTSLGRKPPSQMQNAYASHQFTQLTGRFSLAPGAFVQVWKIELQARFAFVGATLALSAVDHPVSYVVPEELPLSTSPRPPLRCPCLPEPAGGV